MVRWVQLLYGRVRRWLSLPQYIVVSWNFEDGEYWMIFDSHHQVYVNGSIKFTKESAEVLRETFV